MAILSERRNHMEIKGALTLPRKDEFWFDTAVSLMKGKEEEILTEKGDLPKEKGGEEE
jgi:hypothetical protein